MSVASFIASQRADHGVPHAMCCRCLGRLGVAGSTSGTTAPPTPVSGDGRSSTRRCKRVFEDSGGTPRTYGSPRVHEDLVEAGWQVSEKTVAASMARQGLVGRGPNARFRSLTRPDKAAAAAPGPRQAGLHRRAARPEVVRRPDRDPHRRRQALPGQREDLACAAPAGLRHRRAPRRRAGHRRAAMAAAVRGGDVDGVIFHSDKGSEFTGVDFAGCVRSPRGHPIDGPSRLVLRQRRRRELALDSRVRAALSRIALRPKPRPAAPWPTSSTPTTPPAPQQLPDALAGRLRGPARRTGCTRRQQGRRRVKPSPRITSARITSAALKRLGWYWGAGGCHAA